MAKPEVQQQQPGSSEEHHITRRGKLGYWPLWHDSLVLVLKGQSSLVLRLLSQSEMGYSLKPLSTVKWGFTTTKRYPRSLFPVFVLGKSAEAETMEENQDQD